MAQEQIPLFATNSPSGDMTVAGEISKLFRIIREKFQNPPPISIATAYFNPGGFNLLADELEAAPSVRLLLGAEPDPIQVTEPSSEAIEFLRNALQSHDNWMKAERDSCGFSKDIVGQAKRMVNWIESKDSDGQSKVQVRRFTEGFLHGKAFIVTDDVLPAVLAGSSNMTYAGLAKNAELNLGYPLGNAEHVSKVIDWFEHYWAKSEDFDLASLYKAQWENYSPWTVFMSMLNALYSDVIDEESTPKKTALNLTRFQSDGVARMNRLLESLGGVLVADEVGLGKSFLAAEVIKRVTEELRQRVLIICPASIRNAMWLPFLEEYDFSRKVKVMSYEDVTYAMRPESPNYEEFQEEISNFSLVVVDEAHNLRNPLAQRSMAVDKVILSGKHPKKVVLLTATPVNNSLMDLETLIRYFVRDDAKFAANNIPSIRAYIKQAQSMDPNSLTPEHLFDLMDQVAVKRTRKFVKHNYKHETIEFRGQKTVIEFPEPIPYRIDYELDEAGLALVDAMIEALQVPEEGESYIDRRDNPNRLVLARYTSSAYSLSHDLESYQFSNAGLLRSALLKRLESSPAALVSTLQVLIHSHENFLGALRKGYVLTGEALNEWSSSEDENLDSFLEELDEDDMKNVQKADLFDAERLALDVEGDLALLGQLLVLAEAAAHKGDPKFQTLVQTLKNIAEEARRVDPSQRALSSSDRRKVIIFSSYSDTVLDIHDRLRIELAKESGSALDDYRGRVPNEPVMGAYSKTFRRGASGSVDQEGRRRTIRHFAPNSAEPIGPDGKIPEDKFDILITTDVLAEGVNLQQAGHIINYDLPWNPMRIIQRHGRVDRIGSPHSSVKLGLFFPAQRLNEMLGLEATLERKLAQAEAAVGTTISLFSKSGGREVILSDKSKAIEQMKELLENRGSSLALSGEEFRRRLYNHLQERSSHRDLLDKLPFGIGSGFVNPNIEVNGYVFCVKVGKHSQPWFRFVEARKDWTPVIENGKPKVVSEALSCLVAADPQMPEMERDLSPEAYENAFAAWQFAQSDVFESWDTLTDPAKLTASPPPSFRDAAVLVKRDGGFLGDENQKEVIRRLATVPSKKVERAVRRILQSTVENRLKISEVIQLLDDSGIQPAAKVTPLKKVDISDVQLVSWMAVQGTLESTN
jgi:hypothetical protein